MHGDLENVYSLLLEVITVRINANVLLITKMVDSLKPIESYNAPLTDGPINAPKANVEVQRPDIKP